MSLFVRIGSVSTPLAWKDENPDLYQRRLAVAYEQKTAAYCTCRAGQGLRLSIRRLGSEEKPFYVLARWPKSGLKHRAECAFFGSDPSEDGRLAPGVVRHNTEGVLTVRLDPSLSRPTSTSAETSARSGPRTQPAIALRELLELLWEQADLARWDARFTGKRSAYVVAGALGHAADGVNVGRRRLSERFFVAVPRPSERAIGIAQEIWDAAASAGEGLVVIGTLRAAPEEPPLGQDHGRIFLQSAVGAYKFALEAQEKKIGDVRASFRRELAVFANDDDDRDMVIAIVTIRPRRIERGLRIGEAVDVALMRVTPAWIPVESSYESRVARLLVEEKRNFTKPLRYSGETVQPDFVLIDTGEPYPLEVYGMDHAAYLARRAEKAALYDRDYGGRVWSWDASAEKTIPPFPARAPAGP